MNAPNHRVLVIDDDPLFRESVKLYLEEHDYQLYLANDGAEGLQMWRRWQPDLVLLDIRMPGMSGIAVLEEIKKDTDDTAVIMISATEHLHDVVNAFKLGAWDYLVKPLDDMEILLYAISKALERAALIRENRQYRAHLEEMVRAKTAELAEVNASLEAKNVALREVLATVDSQRKQFGQSIAVQVDEVLLPMLANLAGSLPDGDKHLLDQFTRSLQDLAVPYVGRAAQALKELSATERRLCHLIRRGLANKEIAALEQISPETVSTHRRSIRRKLGLTNRKLNLTVYLEELLAGD